MKKFNTFRLTVAGILSAATIVFSFITLPMFGLNLTFSMVPIAVGGVLFGPTMGAFLGGVFGVVSYIQCFGYSAFGVMMLTVNPFYMAVVCIPTRILCGFLSGLFSKAIKNEKAGTFFTCLSAPILNTLFFMSALLIFFWNSEEIRAIANGFKTANPFIFVLLFVGLNGLIEIVTGIVVGYPVSLAVKKGVSRYLTSRK